MLGLLLSLGAMACTSRKGLVSRPPSDAGVDSREDSERSPEIDSADLAWSHDFGIDVESRAIDAQAQVEAGPPVCGNGIIEPGEMCDDGTDKNVGAYGGCTSDCNYAPNCGDGIKIPSEECDDGIANGRNGYCTSSCNIVRLPSEP